MLLDVRSFEIYPKNKEYFFISESFALNWYIFIELTNKKLLLPLLWKLKQDFLFGLDFLIEYSTSVLSVVWSNPCVGPLLRI